VYVTKGSTLQKGNYIHVSNVSKFQPPGTACTSNSRTV